MATALPYFRRLARIRDGKTTLLYNNADNPGGWPNGIALSPDERYSYMNAGVQNVLRYEIAADGTPELPIAAGELPAQVCATNVAFGDRDSRTLYITAREHVYRIRVNVAGVHPAAARL